jgi:two-component system LytT family sensor kinase
MNKKAVLFLIHIPVWIVVLSIVLFMSSDTKHLNRVSFVISESTTLAFWFLASFYAFYSFLVPKYLEKNKYKEFALFAGLFVLVLMPFLQLSLSAFNLKVFGEHKDFHFPTIGIIFPWMGGAVGTLFCGALGTFYRLGIDWFKNQQTKNELENKNLQSELKTLKSKLNPHLLFNTLNNIDTLIQTSPEQASVALSKLSDLLRYVVYDTEKEKVSIQKEIENLKKYIDLEKIRLVNPDSVKFTSNVTTETAIPPMIFFPFVENGFKHSNLNNPNQSLIISISMEKSKVLFNCINTVNDKMVKNENSGLGLELAKRRLDLLFPNTHKLTVGIVGHKFQVSLEIELE